MRRIICFLFCVCIGYLHGKGQYGERVFRRLIHPDTSCYERKQLLREYCNYRRKQEGLRKEDACVVFQRADPDTQPRVFLPSDIRDPHIYLNGYPATYIVFNVMQLHEMRSTITSFVAVDRLLCCCKHLESYKHDLGFCLHGRRKHNRNCYTPSMTNEHKLGKKLSSYICYPVAAVEEKLNAARGLGDILELDNYAFQEYKNPHPGMLAHAYTYVFRSQKSLDNNISRHIYNLQMQYKKRSHGETIYPCLLEDYNNTR